MNLLVNTLIDWPTEESEPHVERVLWLSLTGDKVITIRLRKAKYKDLPVLRSTCDFETAIKEGEARVLDNDPYVSLLRPEEEIPAEHRQRRDAIWELIAPLVDGANEEFLVNPRKRGPKVADLAKRTGSSRKVIYDYLRKYWRAGQMKNGLLPLFDMCGGKGKTRVATEASTKRGRPSRLTKVKKRGPGLNVTPEMAARFESGIKKFYLKLHGMTLRDAFQRTLEKLFNDGYEVVDGALVPVLPPDDELPTFRQFEYWYHKKPDVKKEKESRIGKRSYNLLHRELLGDSTQMAFGPGSLYQADATICDVYLLSSLRKGSVIGRPVCYFFKDVFSRMITGLSVSLEGPSWMGAMLALDNVMADKVAFCAEYGITITEDDWPCHHLPEAILVDRGEFKGYNADRLVNALNIRVQNTSPYRADQKGIVERTFRTANDKLIHWLPGAVHKMRERGEKDYRLDAALKLHEFTKLIILLALEQNHHQRLGSYRKDEFMIADGVDRYPLDLWKWGVQNRAGHLRTLPKDIVRLNLLPSDTAKITKKGLEFEKLHYTCETAVREQWFVKVGNKSKRVKVSYDPRTLDTIYLWLDGGKSLEVCHLLEADRNYKGQDWYDVRDYFELEAQGEESAKTRQYRSQAAFHGQADHIITQAVERAKVEKKDAGLVTESSRVANIRDNRRLERETEREKGGWELGSAAEKGDPGELVPISPQTRSEEEGYVPPPRNMELLKRLRKEETM